MPNLQNHSVVSRAIRKFFKPIFGRSSPETCADKTLTVSVATEGGPLADELVVRMAASLLKTGRSAMALSVIERACAAKPLVPEYHNSRGLVLRACHRDAEALEAFDTALALRPDYPEAFANWQSLPGLVRARPS